MPGSKQFHELDPDFAYRNGTNVTYDEYGRKTEDFFTGGIVTTTYDEYEREIQEFYDKEDREEYEYEYGDNGKLIQRKSQYNYLGIRGGVEVPVVNSDVTTYEYDEEGRLSKTITVYEVYEYAKLDHSSIMINTYVYNGTGYTEYQSYESIYGFSEGFVDTWTYECTLDEYGNVVSEDEIE